MKIHSSSTVENSAHFFRITCRYTIAFGFCTMPTHFISRTKFTLRYSPPTSAKVPSKHHEYLENSAAFLSSSGWRYGGSSPARLPPRLRPPTSEALIPKEQVGCSMCLVMSDDDVALRIIITCTYRY